MKKIIFLVLTAVVLLTTNAQSNISLKMFNNSNYQRYGEHATNWSTETRTIDLFKFMPGLSKQYEKKTLELILTSCSLKKGKWTETWQDSFGNHSNNFGYRTSLISIMGTYYKKITGDAESRFTTHLGLSAEPYFSHNKSTNNNIFSSTTKSTTIGLNACITPRCIYKLTDKLTMEINLPFQVFQFNNISNRNYISQLSPRQQKTSKSNFDAFKPVYNLNIGLGIRI